MKIIKKMPVTLILAIIMLIIYLLMPKPLKTPANKEQTTVVTTTISLDGQYEFHQNTTTGDSK